MLLIPTYREPPVIDGKGLMRLIGAFGLKPTAVLFDLTFQWVSKRWKLFGVSLGARSIATGFTSPAAPVPASAPASARK